MLEYVWLALGTVLLVVGIVIRICRRPALSFNDIINLVIISYGASLAVAQGVIPSLWAFWVQADLQQQGKSVSDLQVLLLPGGNVTEMLRAMLIGAIVAVGYALKSYYDACKGSRSPRSRGKITKAQQEQPPTIDS